MEKHVNCQFLPQDEGPIPIIVISQGRTGSSVTWNTLYRLVSEEEEKGFFFFRKKKKPKDGDSAAAGMDYESVKAVEITGRVVDQSLDFFSKIPQSTIGPRWAEIYLCAQQHWQQKHLDPKGRIVGFQWKPFRETFYSPLSQATLERLANSRNPRFRIIYNIRNPIDRRLSNLRHNATDHLLSAHCSLDDEDCKDQHLASSDQTIYFSFNFNKGQEFNGKPNRKKLLRWLNDDLKEVTNIKNMLNASGIPHAIVRYDVLYGRHQDKAIHEWRKLVRLVNPNNDRTMIDPDHVTMDDVRKHFSMAKTSSKRKSDVIENYNELKEMLNGTIFLDYLKG